MQDAGTPSGNLTCVPNAYPWLGSFGYTQRELNPYQHKLPFSGRYPQDHC